MKYHAIQFLSKTILGNTHLIVFAYKSHINQLLFIHADKLTKIIVNISEIF